MSTTSVVLSAPPAVRPERRHLLIALAAGAILALVVMAPQAWSVWSRGTFLDPDDALRTVEIRDFLAGQSWFDTVPHRLSPDHPFPMHWSRLVDAPLAALQRVFELGLSVPSAERAMRITAPILFFIAALLASLRITGRLVGCRGLLAAAVLLASAAEPMSNFLPGHIHHHGLQAALLLVAVAALIETAATRGRARFSALAGALGMLSLGIGLQNLPFVVGLIAASLLLWVARGAAQSRRLAAFGLGLFGAVPVFALDVAPDHYAEGACDAFSAAHLVAACATACVCLLLAALTPRLARWPQRVGGAAAGAALVLGLLAWFYPHCLRDPMSDVDPLLKQAWLSGVGEALPLGRLLALAPVQGMVLLLTLLAGLGATSLATWATAPSARAPWAVLLLLAGIGVVGTLWQVRVAASTCTLLMPGLAWLVLHVFDRMAQRPGAPALFLACLVGAVGNGVGWAALAIPLAHQKSGAVVTTADPAICFDPASFTALAALPPGLVLSTIDPGSTILAYTPHTVVAAPYHRNAAGNRLSLLALAASPEAVRALIEGARVRYLALCRASNETAATVAEHPDSLSAALMADRVPAWLEPTGNQDASFLIYRVL